MVSFEFPMFEVDPPNEKNNESISEGVKKDRLPLLPPQHEIRVINPVL
jgi:hypothetical protein